MRHFDSIVGEENVSSSRADLVAYSTDASQLFGEAELVVWPTNAEQVHKIILYANRTGLNLVPRGAGTNLVGGVVPEKSVVIDLSRMNRIVSINIPEMYAVVEPGVVLADLNMQLEKHGLFFPIIPSSEKVATVGGMVASNAAGLRAVKYGRMQDWVLELMVIDGTGKQFVLKGDDVLDFVGSEGTLGIITSAKLKLTTQLKITSMELIGFDRIEDAVAKVREFKERSPSMLEFFDRLTAKLLGLEEKYYILAEFEDESGSIKKEKEIAKMVKLREDAYPVLAANGYSVIEDPRIDLDDVPELVRWLEANNVPCPGHIGIGVLHPTFADEEKLEEFYELVNDLEGSLTGEHGIGLRKKNFVDKETAERFRKLKQRFDPNNILNRGKII